MLIVQALAELLKAQGEELLPLFTDIRGKKLDELLFQCQRSTLKSQSLNGSWGDKGPMEETAYAVLTLVRLATMIFPISYLPEIKIAVSRGRRFLMSKVNQNPVAEHLWIGKVRVYTFGIRIWLAVILT